MNYVITWTQTEITAHKAVVTAARLAELRAAYVDEGDLSEIDLTDGLGDGLAELSAAEVESEIVNEFRREDIRVERAPDVTLHMEPATEYRETTYGVLWTSAETVYVKGRAAHNPHHPHTVDIWRDASCTGGWGTHVFNAHAVVIAATPVERPPNVGTVREHDWVRLVFPDGRHEDYTVTAGALRDPKLTPIAEEPADEPEAPAFLQVGEIYPAQALAAIFAD